MPGRRLCPKDSCICVGVIRQIGRVDHGDTFLDNYELGKRAWDHDLFQAGDP